MSVCTVAPFEFFPQMESIIEVGRCDERYQVPSVPHLKVLLYGGDCQEEPLLGVTNVISTLVISAARLNCLIS